MAEALAELGSTVVQTSAAGVQMGKINIYNASGGALAPQLPALSGLSPGAVAVVVKYAGDATSSAVTVTCAGSDTFLGGATTELLNVAGNVRRFQVIQPAATKYWIALEGYGGSGGGGGSGISPATIDAKGDLLVGTADNTVAKLTVGANGTVPVAASAQAEGILWRALTTADIAGLDNQLTLKQAASANLTTLAGLTPTTNNFINSVGSAWASRTPAQVRTTLSLDLVNNTSDATKWAATKTLTNTEITPRYVTVTSSATPVIDLAVTDVYGITALAVNASISATGTTSPERPVRVFIIGTAARNLTWDSADFENGPANLPTGTTGTQRLDCLFFYNSISGKLRLFSVGSA